MSNDNPRYSIQRQDIATRYVLPQSMMNLRVHRTELKKLSPNLPHTVIKTDHHPSASSLLTGDSEPCLDHANSEYSSPSFSYERSLSIESDPVITSYSSTSQYPLEPLLSSGPPPQVPSFAATDFPATFEAESMQAATSPRTPVRDSSTHPILAAASSPTTIPAADPITTVTRTDPSRLSERSRKDNERLAAVNGIVTPSKLAPGVKPPKSASHARDTTKLDRYCPICDSAFGTNYHVKSHFPGCAIRYGNPTGAKWDDAIPPQFKKRPNPELGRRRRDDGQRLLQDMEGWRHRSRSQSPR